MNQIDVVLILNLEKRVDRLYAIYGALWAAGVPKGKIKRWPAISGDNFQDRDALIQAATDDGFPEFSHLILDRPHEKPYLELNIKSQAWNYCQMLRYLVETQQTGVILYDDRFIKDWINLQGTYHVLKQDEAQDPVILQLDYYFSGHFNQKIKRHQHQHLPYIQQGPTTASENAMVYSPDGAEWLLARILEPENEGRNMEATIARLAVLPRKKRPYFWSVHRDFSLTGALYHLGSDIQLPGVGHLIEIPNAEEE